MPKTEKETKKDVTSMQQEIKRRNKTSPGTPTDVGIWEGSPDTKYRWASILSPVYALGFFSSLAINVTTSKLMFILHTLTLASLVSTATTKILIEGILLGNIAYYKRLLGETESLTLVDDVSTELS